MIGNLNEDVAVAAFMEGVSSFYCLMILASMAPKTMSELLDEVNKQIGVKETLQGRNMSSLTTFLPSSKRQGEHSSLQVKEKGNKKSKKNRQV